jgi:hypothetical protein
MNRPTNKPEKRVLMRFPYATLRSTAPLGNLLDVKLVISFLKKKSNEKPLES